MHSYLQNGRRVIKVHNCTFASPNYKVHLLKKGRREKKETEPRTEKKKKNLARKCICLYLLFSYGKKNLVSMTRGPGFLHTHYTIRLRLLAIFFSCDLDFSYRFLPLEVAASKCQIEIII